MNPPKGLVRLSQGVIESDGVLSRLFGLCEPVARFAFSAGCADGDIQSRQTRIRSGERRVGRYRTMEVLDPLLLTEACGVLIYAPIGVEADA